MVPAMLNIIYFLTAQYVNGLFCLILVNLTNTDSRLKTKIRLVLKL